MTKMYEYEFTVKLLGCGTSLKEAWQDVVQTYGLYLYDEEYSMPEEYEQFDA